LITTFSWGNNTKEEESTVVVTNSLTIQTVGHIMASREIGTRIVSVFL
jgi:hypothetical protein